MVNVERVVRAIIDPMTMKVRSARSAAAIVTRSFAEPSPAPAPAVAPVVVAPVPRFADPHRLAMRLALEADVDVRTARKAIEEGADAVRGRPGERVALAAKTLGITLGSSAREDG